MSRRSPAAGQIRTPPRETEGAIPDGLAGFHHCEGDGVAGTPHPADASGPPFAVSARLLEESRRLDGGAEPLEGGSDRATGGAF